MFVLFGGPAMLAKSVHGVTFDWLNLMKASLDLGWVLDSQVLSLIVNLVELESLIMIPIESAYSTV